MAGRLLLLVFSKVNTEDRLTLMESLSHNVRDIYRVRELSAVRVRKLLSV